ncbi:RNA-binding region-containing protein 3 [Schistosoma japonicum]|nr:RNA-binding region-containing protein 3 [Schistosoma japonicum]
MKSDDNCLIFKHFPTVITEDECVAFLKSLGATTAQYFGHSGSFKYCAYAEFTSEQHAWNVIKNLHQKKILDRRLSVEFAQSVDGSSSVKHQKTGQDKSSEIECSSVTTRAFSAMWDSSFEVPSRMYYEYPGVSNNILTNIVRSLASCPAFYNQVLHIMNKLHLPPPFDDPEHFPGDYLVISASDYAKMQTLIDNLQHMSKEENNDSGTILEEMDLSSGAESELASDDEIKMTPQRHKTISVRRRFKVHKKLPNSVTIGYSRTSKRKDADVHDLFEPREAAKKLNLPKIINVNSQPNHSNSYNESEGGFGLIHTEGNIEIRNFADKPISQNSESNCTSISNFRLRKEQLSDEEHEGPEHSIPLPPEPPLNSRNMLRVTDNNSPNFVTVLSLDEIISNRLKAEDHNKYPVFAKYDAGTPTSRLYLKNLSQTVTETDLFVIFGVFSNGPVTESSWKPIIPLESTEYFSIRLLTEGRMKGQAFIGLACESTAKQALEATNGYMLYDRPIVVQFARGAKAKADEKSLLLSK